MLRCYAVDSNGQPVGVYRSNDPLRPDRRVDSLTRQYMAEHRVDYATAYKAVLTCPANESVVRAYGRQQWSRS